MQKLTAVLVFTLFTALASAQTAAPKAKVVDKKEDQKLAPRRSFAERVFGPRATPTPTPTPKPTPRITSRPKSRPRPAQPATTPTKPAIPAKPTTPATAEAKPAKPDTAGMDDAAKFKMLKATALEDEQIKALKVKADTAIEPAEATAASIAYNKALFRKIRTLDPSISDFAERMEQALLKRVSAEKKTP